METLYHQTNRLVQETQECFQKLESLRGSDDTGSIEAEIQARIDSITSNCEKLDILVHKEPPGRRQNVKLRVDQLKYDNRHLQAALRMFQNETYKRRQLEQQREDLLSRRFATNAVSDADTTILIDHSLQHNTSLHNVHRGMDDMLMSGTSILENMREQRTTLKGAHKRMLDIANTMGLSNTTMRFIERRVYEDKYILYGGMGLTLIIIFLLIFYFRW